MNAPRFRKLVDIADGSEVQLNVLEKFLNQHNIYFRSSQHEGFTRCFVHENDLCAAQSVLMALADVQG